MLDIVNISDLSIVSEFSRRISKLQEQEAWIGGDSYFVPVVDRDERKAERVLCEALGLPEPVLFEDNDEEEGDGLEIDSRANMEDEECVLNQVIELQERIAVGIKMIQECKSVLSSARAGNGIPYEAYIAWCEREKLLWKHWNRLREECMGLVGEDKYLWFQYFSLVETSIDRNGYTNDETECPDYIWDIYIGARWLDDSVDSYLE